MNRKVCSSLAASLLVTNPSHVHRQQFTRNPSSPERRHRGSKPLERVPMSRSLARPRLRATAAETDPAASSAPPQTLSVHVEPLDDEENNMASLQELDTNTSTEKRPSEGPPGSPSATSLLLLNLVAIIWGSQHAIIKMVVNDSDAGLFTLLRFSLAAFLASPYIPGLQGSRDALSEKETKTAWRWGAEMGFWMFLGFSTQAVGLGSTTAQRSGFLLYLNVKFVPFFAKVLLGREISTPTWVSAFVAFFGTFLLATDGYSLSINEGDLWSIAAAASSAMFILRLEKASQRVPNSARLNAACLVVVTSLAAFWSFLSLPLIEIPNQISSMLDIARAHPLEIVYLGGVTTALANYIQTKAQKDVPAERASVIYSMDPVYGAAFSYALLGESLGGWPAFVGAGLIFAAAASNAFLDLSKPLPSRKDNLKS